jgi:hypothetical protein
MATTYNWTFPTLQTYAHQDGLENIVYIVHWYYTGTREANSASYSHQLFGAQQIAPFVSGSRPFIPYAEITEQNVTDWIEESIGQEKLAQMQASIDLEIDNKINPPIAYLPPPWTTPTPSPTSETSIYPTFEPMPEPTPTPSSL